MFSTVRPRALFPALALGLFVLLGPFSRAQPAEAPLATALFPFHSGEGVPTTLERTVTEMVSAKLRSSTEVNLVSADRLSALAKEAGLDLSSLLSPDDMRLIASRAGAEILISGRTQKIDGEVIVLSRIAGVRTSQSEEVLLSSALMGRLRPLIKKLGEDILQAVVLRGADLLVEKPREVSPPPSCGEFAGRSLPLIFTVLRESYGEEQRSESAGEAELHRFLRACGFALAERRETAQVIVFGRAVGRKGDGEGGLTSIADVELRAVAPAVGRLLAVARITHTASDRPALLPGSIAFREAAAAIAPEFFEGMVESWDQRGGR